MLWHTLSGSYYAGLDQFCPAEAVTCLDNGKELELLGERSGTCFYSMEKQTGRRVRPSNQCIEETLAALLPTLRPLMQKRNGVPWVLVTPYKCRTLEAFAGENGHAALVPLPGVCDLLNRKRNLFAGLDALNLPRIPGRWTTLPACRYAELAAEFGARFVAQLDSGISGSGTAIIASADEFESAAAKFGQSPAWVAPYAGNVSLNVNGLALEGGTVVCAPSVQLVGRAACGAAPGAYCGNDYTAASGLSRDMINLIIEQTGRIGGWIATLGYRGIFGLDFVLDERTSKPYPVDLNPRWQGSTALLTQAEAMEGRLPLAAADIACRLGLIGEDEILRSRAESPAAVEGAQLVLRWNHPQWGVVKGDLKPGVYTFEPEFSYRRPGVSIADCRLPGEALLTGGVPRSGALIAPGAYLIRISTRRTVLAADSVTLIPGLAKGIDEVVNALRIEAADAAAPAGQ